MKVLFLNPPFLPRYSRSQRSPAVTKSGTLYYPVWLAYCAGYLQQAGFEVKLIDAPAEGLSRQNVLDSIKNFAPSLVVMDTSTPSIYNDAEVALQIKQTFKNIYVVAVGPHVSALPAETLALSGIDAVARGEYEITILDLANALKNNSLEPRKISGISFIESGKTVHNPDQRILSDMDSLPMVSSVYKEFLEIKNYFFAASLYPEVQILTARGCPFKCFFCLWPQTFQGRVYRTRSPRSVVNEFIYIKNELPSVKGVVIEDDTFSVDNNRVLEICDLLIKDKASVPWNANVRTDLDIKTMRRMKEAGCYLLIVGIESGEQMILNNIEKGEKTENIQKFFDNAKRAGLLVHAAFMAGNPGETEMTLKKNLSLAKRFLPDTAQFFPLMPYPGTKAYAWAKQNGYLKVDSFRDYLTKDGLHNCVIDLPGLPAEKLMGWCNYSRRAFYLSYRYLSYKFVRLIIRPYEMIRTYKAILTFRKYILRKR